MVIGFANSNRMTSENEGGGHDESERAFSSEDHYGRLPVGHTLTSGTDEAVLSERGHEKSSGALTRLLADAKPDPDSEAVAPVAARLASHPGCDVRPVSSEERSIWGSRYQYQKTTGPGSRPYSFFGTFCLVFEFENEELVARSEVDALTCGSISDDAPTFPWGIQGLVYGRSSDFGRTADCVRVRRRVTAALFWGFRIPPYLRQWGREVTLALHSLAHWAWEVLLAPALPQSVVVRLGPRQRAVHLAGGKSAGIGGGTGGGRSWFQQL
eukprot:g3943.t1